ncbi:MAG: fasciclin domain-containing protein [Myxococcota bacterium]
MIPRDAGMVRRDAGMVRRDAGMVRRDAGRPMIDGGMPELGRPDAGRPDAGPPDMGGTGPLCPTARPPVPRTCGRTISEPPCFVAQLAREPETRCFYQALQVILACDPSVRGQLAGLDLLAPTRTLFAPTNEAMEVRLAALGLDLAEAERQVAEDPLCRDATDAQREAFTELFFGLAYHIVDGRFDEADLRETPMTRLDSVLGQLEGGTGIGVPIDFRSRITVRYVGDDLVVRRARVTRADIAVTVDRGDPNTVLHAVDTFLPVPTVLDVAALEGFGTFVEAAQMSAPVRQDDGSRVPMVDVLRSPALDLTLFVPDEAAFARLDSLPGRSALRSILLFHGSDNDGPLNGGNAFLSTTLPAALETLAGPNITIDVRARPPTVEGGSRTRRGADIVATDLQASNGVVHVINRVMTPP